MEYISEKTIKLLNIKPRPRTWLGPFYDHKTGKKYYIRRRDLSYFQMRKKYPKTFLQELKYRHIFEKKHPFTKSLEGIEASEMIFPWIIADIIIIIVTFYTVLLIATWAS